MAVTAKPYREGQGAICGSLGVQSADPNFPQGDREP